MWLVPTKKEVKKEFEKIQLAFKERDLEIKELKENIKNNSLKIATLEGAILNKSQSQAVSVSSSLKKSQSTIETKLIQRIRSNKKSIIMAEIQKLLTSNSILETYQKIVLEKGLCSKASFYRYIQSLKSQKLLDIDNKC